MTKSSTTQLQRRLLRAVAAGDELAFSRLYDILGTATYAVFRRRFVLVSDADCAMKAMWLSVWQNARTMSHHRSTPSELILARAEAQ